jgi:hypothetical protein
MPLIRMRPAHGVLGGKGLMKRLEKSCQVFERLRRWHHGDEHPHRSHAAHVVTPVIIAEVRVSHAISASTRLVRVPRRWCKGRKAYVDVEASLEVRAPPVGRPSGRAGMAALVKCLEHPHDGPLGLLEQVVVEHHDHLPAIAYQIGVARDVQDSL